MPSSRPTEKGATNNAFLTLNFGSSAPTVRLANPGTFPSQQLAFHPPPTVGASATSSRAPPSGERQVPAHLPKLLLAIGWKLIPQPSFQGFAYVSPQGEVLESAKKVTEVLLGSQSKYNGRQWLANSAGIHGATSGLGDRKTTTVHQSTAPASDRRGARRTARSNAKPQGAANGAGASNLLPDDDANAAADAQRLNNVLATPHGEDEEGMEASANGCAPRRARKGNRPARPSRPRQRASKKESGKDTAADAKHVAGNLSGSTSSGPILAARKNVLSIVVATGSDSHDNATMLDSNNLLHQTAANGNTNGQSLAMPLPLENGYSSKDISNGNSSRNALPALAPDRKRKAGSEGGGLEQPRRQTRRCTLVARNSSTSASSKDAALSETRYTILSWLIDLRMLMRNARIIYVPRTGPTMLGRATRMGVRCDCCDDVVTMWQFQVHSGSKPVQTWERVLLADATPMLLCLKKAWDQEKEKSLGHLQMKLYDDSDPSDDACGICADGGDLICCDSCTSTFHQECLTLKAFPEGTWNCPYCRCTFCRAADNGLHGGTTISEMFTCQQCKQKYHENCRSLGVRGCQIGSYCSNTCKKLDAGLSNMVGIENHAEDGFSWVLLKLQKEEEDCSLGRLSAVLDCNLKLALALAVLQECFLPVTDRRTGIDMLLQAVYSCGSCFKRLDYEGFYTMVLEKDGEIISAAVLRFHGTRLAEMPFVGTLPAYQKQGMCHRLLKAVKQLLASLQVEKLVTSAVSDLVETWKRSFSFIPLEPELREEVKNLSLVVFADTTLLQKPIPIPQASAQQGRLTASTEAGTDNNIPTDLLKYTSPNGSDGTPPLTDDERAALEMETFSSFSALLTGNAFPPFCRSNLQAAQQQYLAAYEFAQGSLMATGVNSTSLGYGSPFGNLLRGWP